MAKDAPVGDHGDAGLAVQAPPSWGAGVPGVVRALGAAQRQLGVRRSLALLPVVNKPGGIDCPGCAWPDPSRGHIAEFCENGAKAVAEEATLRRVTRDFFANHSVADLASASDHWLGSQGRLTEPMWLRPGATHYEPISWEAAFDLVAHRLRSLDSPDRAVFYTSGRTSNEAAYLFQLFVRCFGTNNLPDCSNLCHESSGAALSETIGIGKGTVTLTDVEIADLVVVAGQNPGTNHPRMLASLEKVKDNGGRIIAVNPLKEAGLVAFRNPQRLRGVVGRGTALADAYFQVRLNGDLGFFAGVAKLLLAAERSRGGVLDHAFIDRFTDGFDAYVAHLDALDWADIERATSLTRDELQGAADEIMAAGSVVVCWAMGLTQHKNSVPTIREIVNLLLLRGNIGRPGAGPCPVRGHSNVQGDRTVGINERPPRWFLAALEERYHLRMNPVHGFDVVTAVRAMRDGDASVFVGLGGNFVRAAPDSAATEAALRNTDLTVQISTKLNGSHAVTGREALILPTLGRTEVDTTGGRDQVVTVEDSMGMVHASRGRVAPASPSLRSEVAIVAGIAAGCRAAGCALIGGETAEHPGLLGPQEYDVAGAATGVVEYDDLLGPHRVQVGDALLAIPSSGLHANGFSLVRAIVREAGWSWERRVAEFGRTLGEELLEPTRVYARDLIALIDEPDVEVHALSHVTGGGLAANVARVLPSGTLAILDRASWRPPAVFEVLTLAGRVPQADAERTFNQGVGFVAALPADHADRAAAHLARYGLSAWQIGTVVPESQAHLGAPVVHGAKGVNGGGAQLVGVHPGRMNP